MSSGLLIDEPPLILLPSLAAKLGLNEAIVLQQIQYWLSLRKRSGDKQYYHQNRWWVYGSVEHWTEQFPFWSVDTTKRALLRLRELGILLTANYNTMPADRTLWYSIDYNTLRDYGGQEPQTKSAVCPEAGGSLPSPIPETTTETKERKRKPRAGQRAAPESGVANTAIVFKLFGEYYGEVYERKYVSVCNGKDASAAKRLWNAAVAIADSTRDPAEVIKGRLDVAKHLHDKLSHQSQWHFFPEDIAVFASKFSGYLPQKLNGQAAKAPATTTTEDSRDVLRRLSEYQENIEKSRTGGDA
jgi:hypothetical protein